MSIEKRPGPGVLREIRPKIGKYEIKALLGEGATGAVYEGYDPDIQRRVAIKTLHPHLLTGKVGEGLLARFKREAISAARCIHPNVVTVLEYGQHENRPFIVMEYVDGISVQRFMKQRQRQGRGISMKRSLTIISGLLRALHAAHWHGIIHRDVKASNVLIERGTSRIKLADFGMARITENSDLTMIGSLIGTPRYMAPEVRFGLEADARADVFSAARLLLELLKMLPESTKIPRSPLPEISDMPPGNRIDYSAVYPTALIHVLVRGLAADRDKRYQSVAELMHAIKQSLPNLHRQTIPAVSAQPAAAARPPAEEVPANEDEVDTMTNLLADFMGPIATLIMEEHETRSTTADNLALEISREIPEREQQREFLRRWQGISASRRASLSKKEPTVFPDKQQPQRPQRSGDMLDRISNEFAHYLEPISKTLLRGSSNKSTK